MREISTAAFALNEIIDQRRASDTAWFEFFNNSNLSMGVYNIAAGTNDRESHGPHDRDEVYIGVKGKGRLSVGNEVFEVTDHSIIFVGAGIHHHFHDVIEDLTVLVLFSGAKQ